MTIDLHMLSAPTDWPYENEEYVISFILDTMPFFSYEPIGEEDPAVILHRFGGTYGPATFLLTASQREMSGTIRITLVNDWGVPIERVELKCVVSNLVKARPEVAKKRLEVRVPIQPSTETESEETLQGGDGMSNGIDVSNEDEMRIGEDNIVSTFEEARYDTDQITGPPPVSLTEKIAAPVSIFCSYTYADKALREQLEVHLSLLQRQGLISGWRDRVIVSGADWAVEIDKHLETAWIILFLISPDFLASDYCYGIEVQRALERHHNGKAQVIPIILRPVDLEGAPFAHLQCLPHNAKAVTTWQNPDEAFLTIAEGLHQIIEQQRIPARPLSQVEKQNRIRLMKRMQATWIEGVLQHSLRQAALLILGLQEQEDALANPWRLVVQEINLPPRPLPAGTSIVHVYDEADGKLLILGEPGSGKTTLLLELTRTLLERAEADEQQLMPVVFHLSSWAVKRPSLSDWLVEELLMRYEVPRQIAQSWIKADQVIPLLDGLDEVAEQARDGCVKAINAFYQSRLGNGSGPLVVCCRSQEYLSLPTRIILHRAVSIPLLTDEQIDYYLQSAGGRFEALQHALRNDPVLYEMAHRPLMLNIFTLAYRGAADEDLPSGGTRETQQHEIFATYVQRMLVRRGPDSRYKPEQTIKRLAWLAKEMQQHHQSAFSMEQVQLFRRLRLWSNGTIPFNFKQFLDFAVERLLLRRVGPTDYCFVHPLLLDYFASLERT